MNELQIETQFHESVNKNENLVLPGSNMRNHNNLNGRLQDMELKTTGLMELSDDNRYLVILTNEGVSLYEIGSTRNGISKGRLDLQQMHINRQYLVDLLQKGQYVSFGLTCLSQNLLNLAHPVLIALDRESVTSLVKGCTLQVLPNLLLFLDKEINCKGSCPKMFYFLWFLQDLILYQYKEIKSHKNILQRILRGVDYRLNDVIKISEESQAIIRYLTRMIK